MYTSPSEVVRSVGLLSRFPYYRKVVLAQMEWIRGTWKNARLKLRVTVERLPGQPCATANPSLCLSRSLPHEAQERLVGPEPVRTAFPLASPHPCLCLLPGTLIPVLRRIHHKFPRETKQSPWDV